MKTNNVGVLFVIFSPSGMTYGTTIRDLCLRLNPHALRIDEQRLVQFGVLKGIIRRIQKVKRKNEKNRKRVVSPSTTLLHLGLFK